ncbi:Kelch repeat-containing protein [Giardia muris]|uniref:Kelch repeat-containing protein n=1 Tax=Giardia muris TaxID=5742 RepID=A0A4Z1SUB1_GIAMU|nr:Kelch repeat-containing protein [Giardia muris]|eukprot:TNJ28555.1 Kelch repeat-containing protein [Giardia muris]
MRVLFSKVKRNLSNHLLSSQTVTVNGAHYGMKVYREGTTSSIRLQVIEPTHDEVKITEHPFRNDIETTALSGLRLSGFNSMILISITYQKGHPLHRDLQFYLLDPEELAAVHLNLSGVAIPARNGYNVCQASDSTFLVCGGVTVTGTAGQPTPASNMPASTVLADAYVVDLRTSSITRVSNLPYPLRRFSLTYIEGRVLLIGGSQYAQKTSSNMVVFEYLSQSDQWNRLSLFKMRSDHTVVVFKNQYLLLFGGVDAGKLYADLWVFDLAENKWHSVTITGLAPTEGRCLSTVFFESDFCYIISGCGTHKTIYLDSYRFSTTSLRNALGIQGEPVQETSLNASRTTDVLADSVKQELMAVIAGLRTQLSTLQADMESVVSENKLLRTRVTELESHVRTLESTLTASQLQQLRSTGVQDVFVPGEGKVIPDTLHPHDLEPIQPAEIGARGVHSEFEEKDDQEEPMEEVPLDSPNQHRLSQDEPFQKTAEHVNLKDQQEVHSMSHSSHSSHRHEDVHVDEHGSTPMRDEEDKEDEELQEHEQGSEHLLQPNDQEPESEEGNEEENEQLPPDEGDLNPHQDREPSQTFEPHEASHYEEREEFQHSDVHEPSHHSEENDELDPQHAASHDSLMDEDNEALPLEADDVEEHVSVHATSDDHVEEPPSREGSLPPDVEQDISPHEVEPSVHESENLEPEPDVHSDEDHNEGSGDHQDPEPIDEEDEPVAEEYQIHDQEPEPDSNHVPVQLAEASEAHSPDEHEPEEGLESIHQPSEPEEERSPILSQEEQIPPEEEHQEHTQSSDHDLVPEPDYDVEHVPMTFEEMRSSEVREEPLSPPPEELPDEDLAGVPATLELIEPDVHESDGIKDEEPISQECYENEHSEHLEPVTLEEDELLRTKELDLDAMPGDEGGALNDDLDLGGDEPLDENEHLDDELDGNEDEQELDDLDGSL